MACANPASEWGDLATLARGMHLRKSLVSHPRDMDAFITILRAHFLCVICVIFCYKFTSLTYVSRKFSL